MFVYLARHGEALSEKEDPARPLSEAGKRHVRQISSVLASSINILPVQTYHSPKARAFQTASIFYRDLSGSPAPAELDGLLPLDDPSIWGDRLNGLDKDVFLVGHLPHLSRLTSLLLLRNPDSDIVDFLPGTVLCLEKTGTWKVKWMLSPGVLKVKEGS